MPSYSALWQLSALFAMWRRTDPFSPRLSGAVAGLAGRLGGRRCFGYDVSPLGSVASLDWTRSHAGDARSGRMVRGPPLAGAMNRARQFLTNSYARWMLVAAAGLVIFWLLRPHSGPAEGSTIKQLSLPWAFGATGRLQAQELLGSVTVIEAFAGWCGTCKRATPKLNPLTRAKRKRLTRFIGISLDPNLEDARATASNWNLSFPIALADGNFQREFQINALPTLIVVDTHGVVRHARAGAIDNSTLEAWLTELGAGLE